MSKDEKSVKAWESGMDMLVPKDARPYVVAYELWRNTMDWRGSYKISRGKKIVSDNWDDNVFGEIETFLKDIDRRLKELENVKR